MRPSYSEFYIISLFSFTYLVYVFVGFDEVYAEFP